MQYGQNVQQQPTDLASLVRQSMQEQAKAPSMVPAGGEEFAQGQQPQQQQQQQQGGGDNEMMMRIMGKSRQNTQAANNYWANGE